MILSYQYWTKRKLASGIVPGLMNRVVFMVASMLTIGGVANKQVMNNCEVEIILLIDTCSCV